MSAAGQAIEWLHPAQRHGWHMVPLGKLGAWLLLMVISYVTVSAVHHAWPEKRPLRTS